MGVHSIYRNPRPLLAVEHVSSSQLGRCYHEHVYRVTSTSPLSAGFLTALRTSGVVNDGQGFSAVQELAGGGEAPVPTEVSYLKRPDPTGLDTVPAIEVDETTGQPTDGAPKDWQGRPLAPITMAYWSYRVCVRVDSSD